MKINCDIGERGAHHPVDRALMERIDLANIACGGHAGDTESIAAFRALAEQFNVEISAHLSYPDRENFGRVSIQIEPHSLIESLNEQLDRLPNVFIIKFHGALYNDSVADLKLAGLLADWLKRRKITTLITPADSHMSRAAERVGITIWAEVFADRRYTQSETGTLHLLNRAKPGAIFETLELALEQCERLSKNEVVALTVDGSERRVSIQADTLCVHSDSDIALSLIDTLAAKKPPFEISHAGLSNIVNAPAFGNQSTGVTPGGPQDRFAFESGQTLLQSKNQTALEFILPPVLKITRPTLLALTGAHFSNSRIVRGTETLPIPHATVFAAEPNDVIRFGPNATGFRAYLAWAPPNRALIGNERTPLSELVTWREPRGKIRLLKGPEFSTLTQPDQLTSLPWQVSPKSSAMGIQLTTPAAPLKAAHANMISAPVTDGTVQLTPDGPIILMRQRQTIGGYPRIANVIEVDINRLAQFRPGEIMRFEWVSQDTARELQQKQQAALKT